MSSAEGMKSPSPSPAPSEASISFLTVTENVRTSPSISQADVNSQFGKPVAVRSSPPPAPPSETWRTGDSRKPDYARENHSIVITETSVSGAPDAFQATFQVPVDRSQVRD